MFQVASRIARDNDSARHMLQISELILWKVGLLRSCSLPTLAKYEFFRNYMQKKMIKVVVETGTYLGDFVSTVRYDFDRIYSIELSESLYERAARRLKSVKNLKLLCGNSGQLLPEILKEIESPCGFWLDAHNSGGITAKYEKETPIKQELRAIMEHSRSTNFSHVILIDDASNFGMLGGYPTLKDLSVMISEYRVKWQLKSVNNIVTISES